MRYPLDELIDKKTIIGLKIERIDESNERPALLKEFDDYTFAITDYIKDGYCTREKVEKWLQQLRTINGEIWSLESEIRKGKEGELGLEEVGRRAIEIRNKNGMRVKIKSEIAETIGIGYKYVKVDHASA